MKSEGDKRKGRRRKVEGKGGILCSSDFSFRENPGWTLSYIKLVFFFGLLIELCRLLVFCSCNGRTGNVFCWSDDDDLDSEL